MTWKSRGGRSTIDMAGMQHTGCQEIADRPPRRPFRIRKAMDNGFNINVRRTTVGIINPATSGAVKIPLSGSLGIPFVAATACE